MMKFSVRWVAVVISSLLIIEMMYNFSYFQMIYFASKSSATVEIVYKKFKVIHDQNATTTAARTKYLEKTIRETRQQCIIPQLDPFDRSVATFIGADLSADNKCAIKTRGRIKDGILYFEVAYDVIRAEFYYIIRKDEYNNVYSERHVIFPTLAMKRSTKRLYEKKMIHDFVKLVYKTRSNDEFTEYHLHPIKKEEEEIKEEVEEEDVFDDEKFNIVFIMIDSLSNANAQRQLKKTYRYLENQENTVILKGHTINGDGTTQQLLAMLTGKQEDSLPEGRKGFPNSSHIDNWPFIFKDLHKLNYKTLFSEDDPQLGTFQLRLKGFKLQPTLKYLQPWWVEASEMLQQQEHASCYFQYTFDYFKEFTKIYKNYKKFSFLISSKLSHQYDNQIHLADESILETYKHLENNGHLKNTVVWFFGDHGSRAGNRRYTKQGQLEERLPMMSFTVPPLIKEKYPEYWKNLKRNSKVLTTHFDVFATLKHLLSFPRNIYKHPFAKSLLTDIASLNRSCADAGIALHYCPCMDYENMVENNLIAKGYLLKFIEHINNVLTLNKDTKTKCHTLALKKIIRVRKAKRGGNSNKSVYNMIFITLPNNGIYDFTVEVNNIEFDERPKFQDISRINRYGSQADCISKSVPHLRKFCYCRNNNTDLLK